MMILDELDSASRRVETPCGDGTMAWRIWNEAAGAPLVLFHGGNGSWRHWVHQISRFAPGRCVIAPDLPGLGESAMPPEPVEPPDIARVVAAGLRALPQARGADLVGFSFGANIAGHVAAEQEPMLRSLTLVGPGALGVPRTPTPLVKVRDKEGEERLAAHRHNLNSIMIADLARIDDLALVIQEWNTMHARFRSRGFASSTMLKDRLAATRLPLGVIYGERDQVAGGRLAERIAAVRQARPGTPVEVIPGAGHWVMYEAAEAFNTILPRLLDQAARAA